MYKASFLLILSICIVVTLSIAVGKYLNPQLIYFNTGLLLVILLTALIKRDIYTIIFGFISVFIILSAFFQNKVDGRQQVLNEELLDSSIALITVLVVLHIKKLYRSIVAEKKQLDALYEFANEGIIVANSKWEIILVNPEAQKLFMYEAKELIGKKVNLLIPERFQSALEQYRANNHQFSSGINIGHETDFFAVKKTGALFQAELSLSFYEQDKDFFTLFFIIDTTQRKQAEKQLLLQKEQLQQVTRDMLKMNTELEKKVAERTLILQEALHEVERSQSVLSEALNTEKELSEIKSRFVSMASHEFRTPLSTVLSSASLISKYKITEEQPKREKHVFRIKDAIRHLNDMLEDFLSLGKLDEAKVSITVVEFDVHEFLKDVLDEMKNGLKQGQQFILSLEGEPNFVTDKRLLKNVLINLLSNAIKFSEDNKPIYVSSLHYGSRIIIQVKDVGIGIARQDLPHLFSTFYRGSNAVNIQGTGLGLHIVKRYIDLLKGEMTLSSQLNEGTVVNIGLPHLSME